MSFNGNFSIVQNADNASITLTDTSTGADGNLTDRRVFPYKSDGTVLLPAGNTLGYVDWPIAAGATLTISNLLQKDCAINYTVVWISSSPLPSPSTYTKTVLYGATGYTQLFIYQRVQDIAANNAIINDTQYYTSLSNLQTEVSNCQLSVTYGSIVNAQSALDRARVFITNQSKYF